ncbi:acyltransferase family protein, partial [Escherichia coli]|uniref:acyltransferase family protein n=1 Tax=Escherichia coli TaxID=562 RepID=UPI00207BFAD8
MSDTKWFHFIDSLIYSFHMPLFFFLSGLFLMKSLQVRGLPYFIFNKIDTILYPYLIWSVSLFLNFILISLILSLKEKLKINTTIVIAFSFLFAIFIYLAFSNILDTNPLNY